MKWNDAFRVFWICGWCFLSLIGSTVSGQEESARALWIWHKPTLSMLSFAQEKEVTTLYLHVGPGFSEDPSIDAFLTAAEMVDIEVFALAGDPAWSTQHQPLYRWVEEVNTHGGFAGMIVDIEPYLLAEWRDPVERATLIRKYLRGLNRARRRAGATPFLATVPFWFDDPTFEFRGKTLVEHVLRRTDGLSVMAYRDRALGVDGIVDLASFEIEAASLAGKPVTISVETNSNPLDKVTFAEEGESAMEAELAIVQASFSPFPAFRGIAIHYIGSYQQMPY